MAIEQLLLDILIRFDTNPKVYSKSDYMQLMALLRCLVSNWVNIKSLLCVDKMKFAEIDYINGRYVSKDQSLVVGDLVIGKELNPPYINEGDVFEVTSIIRHSEVRQDPELVEILGINPTDEIQVSLLSYRINLKGEPGEQGELGCKGEQGEQGEPGQDGKDGQGIDGNPGVGIISVIKDSEDPKDDSYTINYSDGTSSKITIPHGEDGLMGPQGKVWVPNVSAEGWLSWTLEDKEGEIDPVYIRGITGARGKDGKPGVTYTPSYNPLTSEITFTPSDETLSKVRFTVPKGDRGSRGFDGPYYIPSYDEEAGDLKWEGTKLESMPVVSPMHIKGEKGDPGEGFKISKLYTADAITGKTAFEAMLEDLLTCGLQHGDLVALQEASVEVSTNAAVYIYYVSKGTPEWKFFVDLSGSQGIQGVGIRSIIKTKTEVKSGGYTEDTYTITLTDNSTYTFTVTNGVSGKLLNITSIAPTGSLDDYTATELIFKLSNGDDLKVTVYAKNGSGEGGLLYEAGDNIRIDGSVISADGYEYTQGSESFATNGANAEGANSHAEGSGTTEGSYSHAEGGSTTAAKDYSHAEGFSTLASGQSSHAEGKGASTYGEGAHAEGDSTDASGNSSHSEGSNTSAIGENAHAEGQLTIAYGSHSHAEGSNLFPLISLGHATETIGIIKVNDIGHSQHAFNNFLYIDTCTLGYYDAGYSRSIKDVKIESIKKIGEEYAFYISNVSDTPTSRNTEALEITYNNGQPVDTFNDGCVTNILLFNNHTLHVTDTSNAYPNAVVQIPTKFGNTYRVILEYDQLLQTITFNDEMDPSLILSSGISYIIEGIAYGNSSHSEGEGTVAVGDRSHAEGNLSRAINYASHAEGDDTEASGIASHAEGSTTVAKNENAHSEGYFSVASGENSHAEGVGTEACGYAQHVLGKYNIVDEGYAFIIGNGDDESSRSNAMMVDWDGLLEINNIRTIDEDSLSDHKVFATDGSILDLGGYEEQNLLEKIGSSVFTKTLSPSDLAMNFYNLNDDCDITLEFNNYPSSIEKPKKCLYTFCVTLSSDYDTHISIPGTSRMYDEGTRLFNIESITDITLSDTNNWILQIEATYWPNGITTLHVYE